MIDKSTSIETAIGEVEDGAVVMVGGFGVPGTPFTLIDELVRQGPTGLTVVKNDANQDGMGVDHLLLSGQVDRLIVSHIGLNPHAIAMMNDGTLDVEMCPQGILAERVRAGGAGLQGIVTDIGVDGVLSEGKPTIEVDGRNYLVESAIRADVALLHAEQADLFGNLRYAASARNFNPLMATAADVVIAEAEALVDMGEVDPTEVHTPGPFVDHVVELDHLTESYGVFVR